MNIKNFQESLDYLVKAELTPFIWGHAGIGKSSVVKQYAEAKGYHFFPFYLGTQSDIGDILGLADFVKDKNGTAIATKFATPEWLKNAIDYCNANPDSGAIIFLDEFNRGRKDILSGMFSLALDKTFHTLKLPKNCHVIAAGNPPTDEYFTTDVTDTALMARFVHVKLEPTFDEWLEFAKNKEIDHTLVGFLRDQPQLLEEQRQEFNLPTKIDRRAYERLDRLFKLNTPKHLLESLMVGIIGIERTTAYLQYLAKADKPLDGTVVLEKKSLKIMEKWSNPDNTMTSLLNLTMDNLKVYLMARTDVLTDKEKAALFAVLSTVPKDISYPFLTAWAKPRGEVFRDFASDKTYAQKLVDIALVARGKETQGTSEVDKVG